MAYRFACMTLLQRTRMTRKLLVEHITQQWTQRREMASQRWRTIWPQSRFLSRPSMFSPQVLIKHWECLPVVAISALGLLCESLCTIRLALTRDDVRSLITNKMAVENYDYTERSRPPRRKFLIINDKYEWPPGLMAALKALRNEDPPEVPDKNAKKKK